MRTWVRADLEKFFRAFDGFWPNRLKLEAGAESELLKTWRDVAQGFDVAVAMASLRDLFEAQEQPRAPTPAAFRSIAIPMQRFTSERTRLAKEERRIGEPLMTSQEAAADDSLWDPAFDRCVSAEHLERVKKLRACLARGGSLVEALGGAR